MIFEVVDPDMYIDYLGIFYDNLDKTALGAFQTTARACFMGLAVVMNEQVGPHKDVGDLRDGWGP